MEAGSNISTVFLRVVRGEEAAKKEAQSQMRQQDMATSAAGLGPESDSACKVQ
jgi:hypothetical protein